MRLTRAEQEATERRIREDFEMVQGVRAAVDTLRAELSDPNPHVQVRAASAILRYANKAREREILRRLDVIEDRLTGGRGRVRLALL